MPINDRAITEVKKSVVLLFAGQGAQEVGMGLKLVEEYPEAKKALLERGHQILMKDNMIDEEKAKAEAAAHDTPTETLKRLEITLADVAQGMEKTVSEYVAFQATLKQRATALENKLEATAKSKEI